jgi:hypothetical protein
MANLNGFNANEVEPSTTFDPIPAGKYLAAVTSSEMKPTKTGNASYLQLTFTVLEGKYKDRLVWARLCLNHSNQETVRIARSQLSAICRAIGVLQPRDSVDLHNVPLVITVKVKKNEQTGDLINEVKGFEPKASAGAAPASNAGSGTGQASSTPPWKR